jgi:hypothetical protein
LIPAPSFAKHPVDGAGLLKNRRLEKPKVDGGLSLFTNKHWMLPINPRPQRFPWSLPDRFFANRTPALKAWTGPARHKVFALRKQNFSCVDYSNDHGNSGHLFPPSIG